jgi:hypothetical protein
MPKALRSKRFQKPCGYASAACISNMAQLLLRLFSLDSPVDSCTIDTLSLVNGLVVAYAFEMSLNVVAQ